MRILTSIEFHEIMGLLVVLDSDNVLKIHLLHLTSTFIGEAVKVIKDLMKQTLFCNLCSSLHLFHRGLSEIPAPDGSLERTMVTKAQNLPIDQFFTNQLKNQKPNVLHI